MNSMVDIPWFTPRHRSSQRQYVRIWWWWWWLSFDGDMRAIQRTHGVYICMIYIYIHTYTGSDLWYVFFTFDDGPPQAAAAAVASKEETKSQVQTLQRECSAKGLRRALQTKWNMGRQSKMNQQQLPWFYRKLFCPGIESILWLTLVFTAKWDGLV